MAFGNEAAMVLITALILGMSEMLPSAATAGLPTARPDKPEMCNFAKVYRLKHGKYLSVRSSWSFTHAQ
jgi:hypothetical protein